MEDQIIGVLRAEGALSVGELEEALEVPRRTLQRWLRELVDAGQLRRLGQGRGTRYQVIDRLDGATTWNTDFLHSYVPNRTFYLPADTRAQLHSIGSSAATQPGGTYSRNILDRLLIDLSWNSSRLEGNTYSLLETEELILRGKSPDERTRFETQMILNHKAAIEFLVDEPDVLQLDSITVRNLHAILSDTLLADPEMGGRLRTIPVQISGSKYIPLAIPDRIKTEFEHIIETAAKIEDPFECSFFLLVHLPYLQPFVDVNKRVSRLAANIPFIQRGYYPLSFLDVERDDYLQATLAIYEQNNTAPLQPLFELAYRNTAQRYAVIAESLGEPDPFRTQYRLELKDAVAHIVRGGEFELDDIPKQDRAAFQELLDHELSALHEGNFARYGLRPSEYRAWLAARG